MKISSLVFINAPRWNTVDMLSIKTSLVFVLLDEILNFAAHLIKIQ